VVASGCDTHRESITRVLVLAGAGGLDVHSVRAAPLQCTGPSAGYIYTTTCALMIHLLTSAPLTAMMH
jgi:hypothetical protein